MSYSFSKKQSRDIRNAVRRFNRVIDKLNQQYQSGGMAPIIPEKRTIKGIKENITNYNEFRRELASLNRLTRGKPSDKTKPTDIINYGGVEMTRYQAKQIKLDLAQTNKMRERYREKIGYDERKFLTDTENLGDRKMPNLENMSKTAIQRFIESIHTESTELGQNQRLILLRDNYIKGLEENFSKSQARRIKSKIMSMDLETFAGMYIRDEIPDIGFLYSKENSNARYSEVISFFG